MISSLDIAWAAGFMEGEGSFNARWYKQSRGSSTRSLNFGAHASQVQRQPLERLQGIFGGRLYYVHRAPINNPIWRWYLGLSHDAAGFMMTLYPLMSPWRRHQIAAAISAWKVAPTRGQRRRARTACRNGHPYTPENTIRFGNNWRKCRACNAEWWRVNGARRRRVQEQRRAVLKASGAL